MRLGIYAPYNRSETTAMAIRLVSSAAREGWNIDWLSSTVSLPAHPYWDATPRVIHRSGIVSWAKKNNHRIWFEFDETLFHKTRSVSRTKHDILVPNLHRVTVEDIDLFGQFEAIVCSSSDTLNRLRQLCLQRGGNLRSHTFPSGLRPCQRNGTHSHAMVSAFLYSDAHTTRNAASKVLLAAVDLLDADPQLFLSLCFDGTLDRSERRLLRDSMSKYEARLSCGIKPGLDCVLAHMRRHDWFLYPVLRVDSGLLVSQAQALGVPVIGWDVSPLSSQIRDRVDGLLVACAKQVSSTGAETVAFNADVFTAAAAAALADRHLLTKLQAGCHQRATSENDETFFDAWRDVLELQPA